jgi:putative DNA primase/helicase
VPITVTEIAAQLSAHTEAVCQQFLPAGKRVGREWVVGDVLNNPGTSMQVALEGDRVGVWFDHAAHQGGDVLDIVQLANGWTKRQAVQWAKDYLHITDDAQPVSLFDPLKKTWKRAGDDGPPKCGDAAWAYRDADGQPFVWEVRFTGLPKVPGGKPSKDNIPLRFVPPDGAAPDPLNAAHWQWRGFRRPEQVPLFNLHLLAKHPDKPVLVVEGPKTAVAAAKLFPDFIATTWLGGSGAVERADLTALLTRQTEIVIWPDADAPGVKVATYLKARLPKAKVVKLPAGLPDGWDLADPVPDGISVTGLLDATLNPAVEEPGPGPESADAAADIPTPFRLLGHDEAGFHYLSFRSGRLVELQAFEHTELNLQTICGDDYWSALSATVGNPNREASGPDYKAIAKHLIAAQFKVGHFDSDNIRGLGCWIENRGVAATVVYHAGDRLYVNGSETPLHLHKSPFIYPSRKPIPVDLTNPATVVEGQQLVRLSELLPWASDSWGWVLPSCVFIATICGALDWRPHAWLVGSKGSGKSWIYVNFLSAILGPAVFKGVSTTTEAAIRQVLGSDALPVIFDEIEAKDERSAQRIKNVLELARSASCETGGAIFKGSPSGVARSYRIRSSFIFCSIASGATEAADESRIALMELATTRTPDAPERFQALLESARDTILSPAWCARIRARAILLAGVIRESSLIFQRAISTAAGDSRKGQQYGALAAGYHHLLSDAVVAPEAATAWAKAIDWSNVGAGDASSDGDEHRAFDIILQSRVTLQDADGKRYDRSVEELVHCVFKNTVESDFAMDSLLRIGVYPQRSKGCIMVANRHVELSRIFKTTPYAERWKDQLARIQGAQHGVASPTGMKSFKAVRVPWVSGQQELLTAQ